MVLKSNSEVDLVQGPSHGSEGSTHVDSSQYKNKSDNYHSFKS